MSASRGAWVFGSFFIALVLLMLLVETFGKKEFRLFFAGLNNFLVLGLFYFLLSNEHEKKMQLLLDGIKDPSTSSSFL